MLNSELAEVLDQQSWRGDRLKGDTHMANKTITVTVTVARGDDKRTYALTQSGESKAGTYVTFTPAKDNPDIPEFGKLYVAAKPVSPKAKKS
jgi:hypothetical protein